MKRPLPPKHDGTDPSQAVRGSTQTERHAANARSTTRCVDSRELLGPAGKINIEHNGEIYSLQRTRLGRLILTK